MVDRLPAPIPDIQNVQKELWTLRHVTNVDWEVRQTADGHAYVEYAVYVDTQEDAPIRIDNELKGTLIPHVFASKSIDAWYPQEESTTSPILVGAFGLNPDAATNTPVNSTLN